MRGQELESVPPVCIAAGWQQLQQLQQLPPSLSGQMCMGSAAGWQQPQQPLLSQTGPLSVGGHAEETGSVVGSAVCSAAGRQQWQQPQEQPLLQTGQMSNEGYWEEFSSQFGSAGEWQQLQQLQQLPFSHEGHMSME